MKISKRLLAIADLIDDNSNVIDVGCDHALLDIFLVKNRNNVNCIATDISSKAIEKAKENVQKYNANNITLIVSNGLENIEIKSSSVLVISGMGTYTIIKILESASLNKIDSIILQTNKNYDLLKQYINKINYQIVCEMMVDDKKNYNIIKLKKL